MANYAMTCSCGEIMSLEAPSRDEAVAQFTAFMTQDALDQHMAQFHQLRQAPLDRRFDFAAVLAQFRRDPRQPERFVHARLRLALPHGMAQSPLSTLPRPEVR